MKKYALRTASIDEWGNRKVYCPECRKVFKEEGIYTHLDRTQGHIEARKWYLNRRVRRQYSPQDWPWQHLNRDA